MHFHPNLYFRLGSLDGTSTHRITNPLQGVSLGLVFVETVGPHLDATATNIMNELHKTLAVIDISAYHSSVGGMKFTNGPTAPWHNAGIGKPLPHLRPALAIESRFNAVFMGGAQLDCLHPTLASNPEQFRQQQILAQVIGHQAQFKLAWWLGGSC